MRACQIQYMFLIFTESVISETLQNNNFNMVRYKSENWSALIKSFMTNYAQKPLPPFPTANCVPIIFPEYSYTSQ